VPQSLQRRPRLVRENPDLPKAARRLRTGGARPRHNHPADERDKFAPPHGASPPAQTPGELRLITFGGEAGSASQQIWRPNVSEVIRAVSAMSAICPMSGQFRTRPCIAGWQKAISLALSLALCHEAILRRALGRTCVALAFHQQEWRQPSRPPASPYVRGDQSGRQGKPRAS